MSLKNSLLGGLSMETLLFSLKSNFLNVVLPLLSFDDIMMEHYSCSSIFESGEGQVVTKSLQQGSQQVSYFSYDTSNGIGFAIGLEILHFNLTSIEDIIVRISSIEALEEIL